VELPAEAVDGEVAHAPDLLAHKAIVMGAPLGDLQR
jgi:hypothetical protein